MMVRYTFERIKRKASKRVPCTVCGKAVTRQRTFEQTLNPYNVNADGTPRNREEIWIALGDEAEAWRAEPETHTGCGR